MPFTGWWRGELVVASWGPHLPPGAPQPRLRDGTASPYGGTVILPKDRDPRLITIRRGGTLTDFRAPTQRCAAKCVATKRGYPRVIVASCQRADPGGHPRAPGSGRKHLFSVSCGCA